MPELQQLRSETLHKIRSRDSRRHKPCRVGLVCANLVGGGGKIVDFARPTPKAFNPTAQGRAAHRGLPSDKNPPYPEGVQQSARTLGYGVNRFAVLLHPFGPRILLLLSYLPRVHHNPGLWSLTASRWQRCFPDREREQNAQARRSSCDLVATPRPRASLTPRHGNGPVELAEIGNAPETSDFHRTPSPVPSPMKAITWASWLRFSHLVVSCNRRFGSTLPDGGRGSSMRCGQPSSSNAQRTISWFRTAQENA